jgi:hypothetical protein
MAAKASNLINDFYRTNNVERYCAACMSNMMVASTLRNCPVCNNPLDGDFTAGPGDEGTTPSSNSLLASLLLSSMNGVGGGDIPAIPATFGRGIRREDMAGDDEMERIMAQLLQQYGNEGGAPPASTKGLERLTHITIGDIAGVVSHSFIKVGGLFGEVILRCASFCPSPPDEEHPLHAAIIQTDPFTAHTDTLVNGDALRGQIAFVTRGVSNFASKIITCWKHGAVCVLIMNNTDVWPYDMTDSANEVMTAGCNIPAVMISKENGDKLLEFLNGKCSEVKVQIASRKEKKCIICHDEFSKGDKACQMPCQHLFHADCLNSWLKIRNSCPICRFELETDDKSYEANRRNNRGGRTAADSDRLWSSWYT